jgi:hypothetical protein
MNVHIIIEYTDLEPGQDFKFESQFLNPGNFDVSGVSCVEEDLSKLVEIFTILL